MTLALLAPVPCLHLAAALRMMEEGQSRVAFGTMLSEVFDDAGHLQFPPGTPVLVYASRPEWGCKELFKGPVASAGATFLGWTSADRRTGKHPEHETVRPVSTGDDSPAIGFWEVVDLRRLAVTIALPRLRHLTTGKPVKQAPLGPMLVEWDQVLQTTAPK